MFRGDGSIGDGLWGGGALRGGWEHPLTLLRGAGVPTLPCSYLWKGELCLSGTIMLKLLSTAG